MTINSRKGQAGNMIWMVVMIAGFLIIAVVMIGFAIQFAFVGPAKVSSQLCYSTLNMQADARNAISDAESDAKDSVDYGWGNGKWDSGDISDAFSLGAVSTASNAAQDGIDDLADGIKDSIPNMCSETTTYCIGDAKQVSLCLYSRAVETFYALRGGKSRALYHDEDTGEPFYLYKIYVNVTEGATITFDDPNLDGQGGICNPTGEVIPPKAMVEINNTGGIRKCSITFYTVDELTMILSMMEECSKYADGPLSQDCLCFIHYETGYSIENGLPNAYPHLYSSNNEVIRENYLLLKYALFPAYQGCGVNPDPGTLEGVEMRHDMIRWASKQYPSTAKSGIFYMRLGAYTGKIDPFDVSTVIVSEADK